MRPPLRHRGAPLWQSWAGWQREAAIEVSLHSTCNERLQSRCACTQRDYAHHMASPSMRTTLRYTAARATMQTLHPPATNQTLYTLWKWRFTSPLTTTRSPSAGACICSHLRPVDLFLLLFF